METVGKRNIGAIDWKRVQKAAQHMRMLRGYFVAFCAFSLREMVGPGKEKEKQATGLKTLGGSMISPSLLAFSAMT